MKYSSPLSASIAALIVASVPAVGAAQTPSGGPPSLIQNPQQGATPQMAPPPPATAPAPMPAPIAVQPATIVAVPAAVAGPLPAVHGMAEAGPVEPPEAQRWRDHPGGLPLPTGDPLKIRADEDPLLKMMRDQVSVATFDDLIASAVRRAPALDEAVAQREEAEGARNEAWSRRAPVADLSLSSFKVISRAFSNDPDNVLERSRPDRRTDGSAHIQMPLITFGSTIQRVRAGEARMQAATASIEDTGDQLALRAIGAWYTLYGYRALVKLGEAFVLSQRDLRGEIEQRVQRGVAARGDVAQVESYIAAAEAQLADFRRSRANAEAQYATFFGRIADATIGHAPVPDLVAAHAAVDASDLAVVRAARAGAEAAARDVNALNADRYPQVSAAIDAGRYGVIETDRDYDVRGTVTISLRLGGGAAQRVEQAKARRDGADAKLRRVREEAARDAAIAASDVWALEESRAAIETDYIASRQSRDVLAERFRVSRGTLFDLLGAQSNYFNVAARYIQTVIDLDTSRYALLARTGKLLPALGIDPLSLDTHKMPR